MKEALPDPSLLMVMVESVPEKSSPSTVTPAGNTSMYVPVPWNILFGALMRKLTSLPLTVVGIPSWGPIPRFHTNELFAKSEHVNIAQSVVVKEPWTVSVPLKLTWKVRLALCAPPPPLPLPGVPLLPVLVPRAVGVGVVVALALHPTSARPRPAIIAGRRSRNSHAHDSFPPLGARAAFMAASLRRALRVALRSAEGEAIVVAMRDCQP